MSNTILIDIIIDGQLETLHFKPEELCGEVKIELLRQRGHDPKYNWQLKGADGNIITNDWTISMAETYRPQPFYLSLAPGTGA